MLPVVVHVDLRACGFGRQRFNVLGVECGDVRLIAVTNTTVVNTETMSELLRKIAALGLTGGSRWCWTTPAINTTPRSRHWPVSWYHAVVPSLVLAQPEPHRTLVQFTNVVPSTAATIRSSPTSSRHPELDGIPTTYAEQLETLMTLNFQQFEDVSLIASIIEPISKLPLL